MYIPSAKIKSYARSCGFHACGIAKAGPLDGKILREWLQKGWHGSMKYMENHEEMRLNPLLLLPGTEIIVSVLLSYRQQKEWNAPYKMASYALGEDYHNVMKEKLWSLLQTLKTEYPTLQGRPFVDSAPIMDRNWAEKSGLGWIGNNGCLINKDLGSLFFIGELLLNAESDYDPLDKNRCGRCRRCVEACPNHAIQPGGIIDSNRCISYHTIENKGPIPEEITTGKWIYGCDICQEVCPWNNMNKEYPQEPRFQISENLKTLLETGEIAHLNKSAFKKLFKRSAVTRVRYEKFMANISRVDENSPGRKVSIEERGFSSQTTQNGL